MEGLKGSRENLEVEAGAEFEVRLPRASGTGYRWEISSLPGGMNAEAAGTEATPGTPKPGAPVVQRFIVRATTSGTITFRLRRSWEEQAAQTHTIEVRIRGQSTGQPHATG
ncbi:MAG TPA: protease inhibitor I42 family protein [Sinomonas sp.]|nr:protease inhibitor I42 family protein [Sinomonas sp.]